MTQILIVFERQINKEFSCYQQVFNIDKLFIFYKSMTLRHHWFLLAHNFHLSLTYCYYLFSAAVLGFVEHASRWFFEQSKHKQTTKNHLPQICQFINRTEVGYLVAKVHQQPLKQCSNGWDCNPYSKRSPVAPTNSTFPFENYSKLFWSHSALSYFQYLLNLLISRSTVIKSARLALFVEKLNKLRATIATTINTTI